jgi:tRNA dimethylallyltransferase
MENPTTNLLVVLGPTASGKTRLGVDLAREFDGEIVSADSRQVYRGLDIGAGKDLDEYSAGGAPVSHHLIDIVDLDTEFSVFDFQKLFFEVFIRLTARRVLPIVVGGTGLYLEAALSGHQMVEVPRDPDLRAELESMSHDELVIRLRSLRPIHNTTDLVDRDRLVRAIEIARFEATCEPRPGPRRHPLVVGVRWDRHELRKRIRERLDDRLHHGLIEEVQRLHQAGVSWDKLDFLGLEYRFVANFLRGRIKNRNDLRQKLASAICSFAKRQETWFRRMERRGTTIHWIDRGDPDRARQIVAESGRLPKGPCVR